MRRWVIAAGVASACSFSPVPNPGAPDARPLDARALDARRLDAPADALPPDAPACMTSTSYAGSGSGNHRYRVVTDAEDRDTAFDTCSADGAHLVTIDDAAENAYIAALTLVMGGNVWIGYNDLVTEGAFVWVSPSTSAYTNWGAGEPDNGGAAGGEDCTYMLPPAQSSQWNDTPCGDTRPSVCECEIGYTPPPPKRCRTQSNWTTLVGRRYLLVKSSNQSWANAEAMCEGSDAYLVVVSDVDEENLMTEGSGLAISGDTWIGLSRVTSGDPFTWIDGAAFGSESWGNNEPSSDSTKNCVYIDHSASAWDAHSCTSTEDYACECDPDPPVAP